MRVLIWIVVTALLLTACTGQPETEPLQQATLPSNTPTSTPLPIPTQTAAPTETATMKPAPLSPEETIAGENPPIEDFSGVTLYRATHLMDPSIFQVSFDHWPEDLDYDVIVFVDGKLYRCEELFPEDYPDRVYCWGPAPPAETRVSVIVAREDDLEPLLEIPFVVPRPGGDQ